LIIILKNKVNLLQSTFERPSSEEKYTELTDEIFSVFPLINELDENSFEGNVKIRS